MVQSTEGIIALATRFRTVVTRDDRPPERRYYIHRKNLGMFTDLVLLDRKVQRILDDEAITINDEQRSILELLLSGFYPESQIGSDWN